MRASRPEKRVLLEATEIDCGREADAAKGMRENLMIDEKFKSSQEDAAARAQRLAVLIRWGDPPPQRMSCLLRRQAE